LTDLRRKRLFHKAAAGWFQSPRPLAVRGLRSGRPAARLTREAAMRRSWYSQTSATSQGSTEGSSMRVR